MLEACVVFLAAYWAVGPALGSLHHPGPRGNRASDVYCG